MKKRGINTIFCLIQGRQERRLTLLWRISSRIQKQMCGLQTLFLEKKFWLFFLKDAASEDQDELTDKALAALKLKAMGNRFIFIIKL